MKGSAEVVNAILLIVLMVGLFSVTVVTVVGANNKIQNVVFGQSYALRVRNVVELTQKSLDATWKTATLQILFKTGDSAIDCGIDSDATPPTYWYYYDPSTPKTSSCVDTSCGDGQTYQKRIPEGDKYNDASYNPRICYPQTQNLLETLNKTFEMYKNILTIFDVQTIDMNISAITAQLAVTDDTVENNVTQTITATTQTTTIQKEYASNVRIKSEFVSQMQAADQIVKEFQLLSDKLTDDTTPQYTDPFYDSALRYQDFFETGGTQDNEAYKTTIKQYLQQRLGLVQNGYLTKSRITVSANPQFIVPEDGFWPPSSPKARGLVMHYDALVRIIQGLDIESTSCNQNPPQEYVAAIEQAVADAQWNFENNLDFEPDEITAFVKATIQSESSWNSNANSGVAYGLMQITIATAQELCKSAQYGSITTEQDLFDPQRNIKCGVHIIHENTQELASHTNSKDNLIKLAAAQYNWGRVLQNHGSNDEIIYEEIQNLPQETQDYVPRVLGNYLCYGGFIENGGLYYYHDEQNRRFVQRPITLQFRIADYLPIIDCAEQPNNVKLRSFLFNQTTDPDLICCNELYACNLAIEGLPQTNNIAQSASIVCDEASQDIRATCIATGFVFTAA